MKKKQEIYNLTLSAVFVALSSVLSLIKIFKLPLGGEITLFSMVPVMLIGIFSGFKWGMASSFCYSVIQLIFGITLGGVLGWGLNSLSLVGTVFLDYIIPFSLLGLVGLFKNKGKTGVCTGVILVMVIRFLCHFLSGIIIFDIFCEWKNVPLYSLLYNGSFMLPELIITAIAITVILSLPQVKKFMKTNI